MKKLFVVSVELEVLVVAETAEEAKHVAERERVDWESSDYHACEMTHMPAGWDDDAIPFGFVDESAPDRTVAEWIAAGAAPTYQALKLSRARKESP